METTADLKIYYLSVEDQQRMAVMPFAKMLPWNSFGRKNLGYLYAIAHGAQVIFDFDDDNLLKFWVREASPDPFLDIDYIADNLSETGTITGKLLNRVFKKNHWVFIFFKFAKINFD